MAVRLEWPRALVFDMDGLLLDSERVSLGLFAACAAELGLPWREEVGLSMVGRTTPDSDHLMRTAYGEDYPVEALRAAFGARYEAAIAAGIPLKRGATELLEWARLRRLPCAVATSTRRMRAEAKLVRARLLPYFRLLVCGDEVTRGKPHPEIYETAARNLGVAASSCLALEDSNPGVRAAIAAGMRAVMVPDLHRPEADLRALGVPVARDLLEVRNWLPDGPSV